MTEAPVHKVARLKLDFDLPDNEDVYEIQTRLSRICQGSGMKLMEKIMDQYLPEGKSLKLERMELELGDLDINNLEEDFLMKLGEVLREEIGLLHFPSENQFSTSTASDTPDPVHLLLTYLKSGSLPWWSRKMYPQGIKSLVSDLLSRLPGEFTQLIRKEGRHSRVRKRIAWYFPETLIRELVLKLEPEAGELMLAYSDELGRREQKQPTMKLSTSAFARIRWELILDYLLVEKGTVFNRRNYLFHLLRGIATRERFEFFELLRKLVESAKDIPQSDRYSNYLVQDLFWIWESENPRDEPNRPQQIGNEKQEGKSRQDPLLKWLIEGTLPLKSRQKSGSELLRKRFRSRPRETRALLEKVILHPGAATTLARNLSETGFSELMDEAFSPHTSQAIELGKELEKAFSQTTFILRKLSKKELRFWMQERLLTFGWVEMSSQFHSVNLIRSLIRSAAIRLGVTYEKVLRALVQSRKISLTNRMEGILQTLSSEIRLSLDLVEVKGSTSALLPADLSDPQARSKFIRSFLSGKTPPTPATRQLFARMLETAAFRLWAARHLTWMEIENILHLMLKAEAESVLELLSGFQHLLRAAVRQSTDSENFKIWWQSQILNWLAKPEQGESELIRSIFSASRELQGEAPEIWFTEFKLRPSIPIDSIPASQRLFPILEAFTLSLPQHQNEAQSLPEQETESLNQILRFVSTGELPPGFQLQELAVAAFQLLKTHKAALVREFRKMGTAAEQEARWLLIFPGKNLARILSELFPIPIQLAEKAVQELKIMEKALRKSAWRDAGEFRRTFLQHLIRLSFRPAERQGQFRVAFSQALEMSLETHQRTAAQLRVALYHPAHSTEIQGLSLLPGLLPPPPNPDEPGVSKEKKTRSVEAELKLLADFLGRSHPANIPESASIQFHANLLRKLLRKVPEKVIRLMQRQAKIPQRRMVLTSLFNAEMFRHWLPALHPKAQDLMLDIFEFRKNWGTPPSGKVNTPEKDLNQLFIAALLEDKGSDFNRISWLRKLIRQAAVAASTDLADYLFQLHHSLNDFSPWLRDPMTYSWIQAALRAEIAELPSQAFPLAKKKTMDPLEKESLDIRQQLQALNEETEKVYTEIMEAKNAGIVILWPYLGRLLEMVDLMGEEGFTGIEQQKRAIYVLHFLTSGREEAEEDELLIPKLLCGLNPWDVADLDYVATEAEKEMTVSLIRTAIHHWSMLGDTEVATFRETFLQRSGTLRRGEKGWEIKVDPKTYDLLMKGLPWGIGAVNLSWLPEPIAVEWYS